MKWFTKEFVDSAQNSRLAKFIPSEKIPAMLELLDHRDAVLELHDVRKFDLDIYFQAAVAYRDRSAEDRQSIATVSSIRSFRDSGIFSAPPESRNSLASDITTFSNTSASSPHPSYASDRGHGVHSNALTTLAQASSTCRGSSVHPRPRNLLSKEKKYFCPKCPGVGTVRSADFRKHLKNHCEAPQKRFKCLRCDVVEKEEAAIQEHGRMHDHTYSSEFELPPKKAFGCPFCGSYQQSLEAYARCMCKDQEEDPTRRPRPSLRVRALLQQHDIKPTLVLQCRRRGLDPNAWTSMVWDDANSAWFAERLEYGCNGRDDAYRLGVDDVERFVDALLNFAKLEHTETPVPPVKDFSHSEPQAISQDNVNQSNSFQSDGGSTQSFQPLWSDQFDFRPSESSSEARDEIRKGTATAIQNTQNEYPRSFSPLPIRQPKRPPSTNSSSLEAARSRSRQPPISRKLTQWIAGEEDVLPQFLDPALLVLGEAFYERGHVAQPTSSHISSESQALSAPSFIFPGQNTAPQNLFQP